MKRWIAALCLLAILAGGIMPRDKGLSLNPEALEEELAAELFEQVFETPEPAYHVSDYEPQGNMQVLFDNSDEELLLSGPAGTGKTRGILEYIHRCMLEYPNARTLIIRKTRVSLSESVLVTYERDVLGEDNPICSGMRREYRRKYIYPNGSEIVLGGMDKPTKVLSSEYDIIYIPEAIELSITEWETLISRLRSNAMPRQQLLADTNPDSQYHWLLKRERDGLLRIVYTEHKDNPLYFDAKAGDWTEKGRAYVFGKLARLTGVRRERLGLGKWTQAEGAVYEIWKDTVNLVDPFPIPHHWRRIRSIDFGFNNPFVCQWWAIDPDGRMYLYREIYMSQRTVKKHAEEINRLSEGENIEATVADHDAEDRATLEENGISTIAADKPIKVGCEKVEDRIAVSGDGKPRLFIMRDTLIEQDEYLVEQVFPVCTLQEIPGYEWPKGQDGKPRKEVPVDLHNHGMDAMRYAVMYEDNGQRGPAVHKIRVREKRARR